MSLEAWGDEPPSAEGDCRECDGTGEVVGDDDLEHTCPKCHGSGFVDANYDDEPDMGEFI